MMANKGAAYSKIAELVKRFGEQYASYQRAEYNETLTRRDFIDPFFKALGWDMDNEEGYAEAYREVIHEDKLKIGSATKAPDYSFRLGGGKRLFFVEAKKPSISVKDEIQPAYQVRRYGWSAKLAISIITDFEEFSVYDCTKKPDPKDKASVARIKYISYKDYLTDFDFIWDTFSKERVLKGSFDKFVQSDTHKKGTTTVDKDFLQSLDRWRTYLAISISWNNKNLGEDEINFAVQQTIDRIIFLRIAEDRSIEPYGNLKHALGTGEYYQNLFEQFRKADEKYNSGLFDFRKDRICEQLKIDNKVIKTIVNELYYPECPYEFSVLAVEILGSAYEQFLGKVIRITPAHHAKIEEKPEVRKAGGVYYTPQYIVEYIVNNTVGKLIENKTPEEVSHIRIVDPACGSGSFLIGAYQHLLDFHKDYYSKYGKISKGKKDNPLTPDGNLTTAEKKRILLNNIYGVDIDVNAVEVTKLSLLLKCLEGETSASIDYQLSIFNERVLPTLDQNIKDGNSLIDTDFYSSELDLGFEKKIKPFNWQKAFPEVFKQGGFDAVIGNPPYVKIQRLQDVYTEDVFLYFKNHYRAALTGNYDLYVLFIERGYQLLNKNGKLGFIQPHKFFQSEFGEGIRNYISSEKAISAIVHFGANQIFEGATTYTCLLFLDKKQNEILDYIEVKEPLKWATDKTIMSYFSCPHPVVSPKWSFTSNDKLNITNKLENIPQTLGDITRKIFVGLQTSADNICVLEIIEKQANTLVCHSKSLNQNIEIENGFVKPLLLGKEVKRYNKSIPKNVVIFPYELSNEEAILLNQDYLKKHFPLGWDYLLKNKKELEARERGRFKENWWQFGRTQNLTEFVAIKIMTPDIANSCQFTIDIEGILYHTSTVFSLSFNEKKSNEDNFYLGVLNSKLMWFHIKNTGTVIRGGYTRFHKQYIETFRIKQANLNDKSEKSIHDEIVKLVDQLLRLNEEIRKTKLQTSTNQLQSKIDYCEDRINELVYQLYGLTEEEIRVVEGV